jgi:NADH:ubiquinone oxidoreductase subunit 6 (subunit J)
LFKAPFWRFFIIIIFTGALYLAIAFIVLATLGEAVGEQVRGAIPFVVVGFILALLAGQWAARSLRKRAE